VRRFRIGDVAVGPGERCFLIAELSANHNQSFERAIKLVQAAKAAGADAVKVQTYTPDTITIQSDKEPFRIKGTLWAGRTLHDLYQEAYTPWEWHEPLQQKAHELGLGFFSTPFDETAVDFLEDLGVPAYKIASFENVDLPLLRRVAATGKPVLMSTGMATLAEVDEAVRTLREAGCEQLALLKCTSAYPAPPEEANLRSIPHLRDTFGVVAGLSDHTMAEAVPVAAVALGACLIEKHLTLSRADGGPDSAFSLEPDEFHRMVEAVRTAEQALGRVSYEMTEKQGGSRCFRRSLFVVQNVRAGELFTPANVRSIRPGDGLHTRHLEEVIGRRASTDIERGEPLRWEHVS
jgi:pseudaminic acid synthase